MPNLLSSNHPLGVTFKRFFLNFYFLFLVVQRIKPRACLILGKCSATELHPRPLKKEVLNGKGCFWEHCYRRIHAVTKCLSAGRKTTPDFLHLHGVEHVLTKMNVRMVFRQLLVQVLFCKGTCSGFRLFLHFNVTFLPGLHSTMKPKLLLFGLSQPR